MQPTVVNDQNPAEPGGAAQWLRGGTLESLAELNELCLSLMAERGRQAAAAPLPRLVGELWSALEAAARQRAANCPYLLVDAGFADPARWQLAPAWQVRDGSHAETQAFFTAAGAVALARRVFTFAWHLTRTHAGAARLLLGMAPQNAGLISRCTLGQIETLAQAHPQWLRPRWPGQLAVWQELLSAAGADEPPALERARLRGLALLAGEVRRTALAHAGVQLTARDGRF